MVWTCRAFYALVVCARLFETLCVCLKSGLFRVGEGGAGGGGRGAPGVGGGRQGWEGRHERAKVKRSLDRAHLVNL